MSATPPPDPAASPYSGLSLDLLSTVDRAAEELRRSLFEGELAPGTPLREIALAEALGVSRSTVREALAILVAEGLADRIPNKGTQVRRLDPAQVRDVCRARTVIETAGGTMDDVTMNHIFVKDWADYATVNKVYAEYFPGDKPARYCIQCGLVKPDALVEIASIAHVGKPSPA